MAKVGDILSWAIWGGVAYLVITNWTSIKGIGGSVFSTAGNFFDSFKFGSEKVNNNLQKTQTKTPEPSLINSVGVGMGATKEGITGGLQTIGNQARDFNNFVAGLTGQPKISTPQTPQQQVTKASNSCEALGWRTTSEIAKCVNYDYVQRGIKNTSSKNTSSKNTSSNLSKIKKPSIKIDYSSIRTSKPTKTATNAALSGARIVAKSTIKEKLNPIAKSYLNKIYN